MITISELSKALPANTKITVNQNLVDALNAATQDPIMAQHIRENFVSYASIMLDGKYSTEDYLNAVRYVSFKLAGMSNKDAYNCTFPQRHQALLARGVSEKDRSSYVAAYHKGKLVNAIMQQTLVPMWILNQDVYQKAINTQAELMTTASSELVRTQAANSILTHLAKPKDAVPLINIDLRPSSGMLELQDMLASLAEKQVNLIGEGVSAREIAAQRLGGQA